MIENKAELIAIARRKAQEYGLPADLVCAVIEQESGWDTTAMRFEPDFFMKYVRPSYLAGRMKATEAYARAYSWGLMQIMGETAREEGFTGEFLTALCDPETGIDAGCKHLAIIFKKVPIGPSAQTIALERYNGGSNPNYAPETIARMISYA
jgi:soluble lytic murein transglycosylase-like protein